MLSVENLDSARPIKLCGTAVLFFLALILASCGAKEYSSRSLDSCAGKSGTPFGICLMEADKFSEGRAIIYYQALAGDPHALNFIEGSGSSEAFAKEVEKIKARN